MRLLLVALLLAGAGQAAGAQPAPCRPMDADADDHRAFVLRVDTSTAAWPRQRREVLHLTPVPPDSVAWVQDAAVCQRAAAAYAKLGGPPSSGWERVHVLRLGPYLVIGRPDGHAGGILLVADATTFERREVWSL